MRIIFTKSKLEISMYVFWINY